MKTPLTFPPYARRRPRSVGPQSATVLVGIATAASAFGAMIAFSSASVVVPLFCAIALCAWYRPRVTLPLAIAAAALHSGLFLLLRVAVAGAPVSLFDVVPSLLVISATSIRRRDALASRVVPRGLLPAVLLVVGGAAGGVAIGVLQGNPRYLILQVLRLELQLMLVLAACLIGGGCESWRRAVVQGVMWGGVLAAGEIVLAVAFTLTTGVYFWSLFPFGSRIDNVQGFLATGNISVLRQNPVSALLVLPGLALALGRLSRRDGYLVAGLLAGGVLWLSRGFWGAMLVTMLLVFVFRFRSRRPSLSVVLRRFTPLAAAAVVVLAIAGGVIQQRFHEATNPASETLSNSFRVSETRAAWSGIRSSPFHFVFGLGTGTVVSHSGLDQRPVPSAILENGVLSEWVNAGLGYVLGSALLFFGAGARGWVLASSPTANRSTRAVGLLGLALPALWLEGLVGGTLQVVEPTVVLWLLAGTVLAVPSRGAGTPSARRRGFARSPGSRPQVANRAHAGQFRRALRRSV